MINLCINMKGSSLSQSATLNTCVTVLLPREGALWKGLFPGIQLICSLLLRNIGKDEILKQQQVEMFWK